MDERVEQLRSAERARIAGEAIVAHLLDAAFAVVSYNDFHRRFGPLPHPPPIDLDILRHRYSWGEISEACRKARALLQDAY
ncbi:hypothetical protein [Mesorhizobium sp. WSM4904]|uniref:hypothetical protein n=2 Tax=unclassified Mesorhizobium TaxID=325217 RepID=UPI00241891C4|nr:hypothetical protein [Mesorhizobium sp. WSM4904]WFP61662.1 hypothetical protein QAZ47_24765 [Mesorhizobium sp. WSM4904]